MAELPWSERVSALSINPDMATRGDVARLASELIDALHEKERLNRDVGCVESLCDTMDEFGKPMKDEQWTNLGERIYEIVVEQIQRSDTLQAENQRLMEFAGRQWVNAGSPGFFSDWLKEK